MIKKRVMLILVLAAVLFCLKGDVFAYWVWTPESGKWENPKYAAKDTPEEQLQYALSFYKEKNYKVALRELKKVIKYYPLSKEAPTAQYYTGRVLEELDNYYEAYKAYQKVIDLYPYTEHVDDVIDREFKIADLFFSGQRLSILGPIKVPAKDKAIEIFKAVADNMPYGKYAAPAIFKAGLAYRDIKDYDNAIMMFKKLIDKYPDSDLIDEARFQLAETSRLLSLKPDYDQTPTRIAREEFEDFIKKHPDNKMSLEAKKVISNLRNKEAENVYKTAQFYEARKKPQSAVIYYKEVIKDYPETGWAKKAQERVNELQKR